MLRLDQVAIDIDIVYQVAAVHIVVLLLRLDQVAVLLVRLDQVAVL